MSEKMSMLSLRLDFLAVDFEGAGGWALLSNDSILDFDLIVFAVSPARIVATWVLRVPL